MKSGHVPLVLLLVVAGLEVTILESSVATLMMQVDGKNRRATLTILEKQLGARDDRKTIQQALLAAGSPWQEGGDVGCAEGRHHCWGGCLIISLCLYQVLNGALAALEAGGDSATNPADISF